MIIVQLFMVTFNQIYDKNKDYCYETLIAFGRSRDGGAGSCSKEKGIYLLIINNCTSVNLPAYYFIS